MKNKKEIELDIDFIDGQDGLTLAKEKQLVIFLSSLS